MDKGRDEKMMLLVETGGKDKKRMLLRE